MHARSILLLALISFLLISCDQSHQERQEASGASRVALAREIVDGFPDFEKSHEPSDSPYDHFVILIGENHASITAQIQLAELLDSLAQSRAIDGILVEGSNGDLKIRSAEARFRKANDGESTDALWRSRLEWGQVAGYEYVALKHPSIPVIGVEDMDAKLSYEISQVMNESDVEEEVASMRRAHELLAASVKILEEAGIERVGKDAAECLSVLAASISGFETACNSLSKKMQPVRELQLEQIRLQSKAREAYLSIESELERAQEQQAELERRAPAFDQRVSAFNRDVTRYQQSPTHALGERLTREKDAIEEEQDELERLGKALELFQNEHGGTLEELGSASERIEEIIGEMEKLLSGLQEPNEQVDDAQDGVQDLYFRVANIVTNRARKEWGDSLEEAPPAIRQRILAVNSFYADDAAQRRDAHLTVAVADLRDRDVAMARNILDYFNSSGATVVAVVVGYAHIPGMATQLGKRNIAFIGGGLSGNGEYELWEGRAWAERKAPTVSVFAAPKKLKEISRFLDKTWLDETSALLEIAGRIEVLDRGQYAEMLGEGRKLLVGKHLADQRVYVGEHVVARGAFPGQPGFIYEVHDRARAKELISELSDEHTEFVYAFEEGNQYRVATSKGEQSLSALKDSPPTRDGDYVALFHEPDIIEQGGKPVSEVWDSIRPSGAGGRGGGKTQGGKGGGGSIPPGDGPWYQADFFGEGPRKSIGFFRTYNPRRAALNLKALRRQGRISPEGVTILENPTSLMDIPFTPRDGEHSGVAVLLARNEAEFRVAVENAAVARKLENKQIVLITCGEAFAETRALREGILNGSALTVWTPDRQLSESAGLRLLEGVKALLEDSRTSGNSFRDMDELINKAIGKLRRVEPDNVDLRPLTNSSSWALVLPEEEEEAVCCSS